MEYATVQGVDVPKVGLGTWRMEGEACRGAVETALDLGYRHVDTAQVYENEREVGRAIAASDVDRDDVFLTTKVNPREAGYDDLLLSVGRSLERLGTDYVDLLLLHWPNPLVRIGETMDAMATLVDRGVARHVGVSNFNVRRLKKARRVADVPVFADQVQFHPYSPQRDLLRYCQREDVLLTAYSPLAQGNMLRDDVVTDIGRKYDRSPAQVAVRWATQHRNVVTIPKSTSREHLRENLNVFDFKLTREEVERITRPSRLKTGATMVRGMLGS
ncbi:aldo/keto reductase [Halobium palmae]|uniref:Aldo/keto reductase n=1 Tax=Halobium palmae TaxID=1776492 RepID=A0ABD5S1Z8_9EURY